MTLAEQLLLTQVIQERNEAIRLLRIWTAGCGDTMYVAEADVDRLVNLTDNFLSKFPYDAHGD